MRKSLNIIILLVVTLSNLTVQAGGVSESEEAIAARDVWHAAKLRGVAFRAVGQEPAWLLEMTTGESILLTTNYGQNRIDYPYVEPEIFQDLRKSVFSLESGNLVVIILGRECTDSMSGEKFEVTVEVILPDKKLNGCGRALY
jgi:uncharacterized membrane protein